MKIIKTYYLIDYENVGSEGFKGCGKLRETDIIHLFYTDNSRKIDLDIINDHGESKLVTHKVPTGNQSADMHLGSYLVPCGASSADRATPTHYNPHSP